MILGSYIEKHTARAV